MARLILHNDTKNSFFDVIETLSNTLSYNLEQSEQLATLAHLKGSITIKEGSEWELSYLQKQLQDYNLTVTVTD